MEDVAEGQGEFVLTDKDETEPPRADAAVSRVQRNMIDEALAIESEDAQKANTIGYLTNVLVQATLPHSDPKLPPGQMYTRTNGVLAMSVVPTSARYGIPYGAIPRIVLAWLCTEAKRTQSRHISLGENQTVFMRRIGQHNNGRDIKRVRDQSMALFRSVISVEYMDSKVDTGRRMMLSDQDSIFWHPNDNDDSQMAMWDSTLELSEKFYQHIMDAGVPLDLRIYNALTRSPLAMDIYAWLVFRMYTLLKSGKPKVAIPWDRLIQQFGVGYAGDEDGVKAFKYNFRRQLKKVLMLYREADGYVADSSDHLILTPCPLHIQERKLYVVQQPSPKEQP